MEPLKKALKNKKGLMAVVFIVAGILMSTLGGNYLPTSGWIDDLVVISGCLLSVIGTQQLCQLIIYYRDGGE